MIINMINITLNHSNDADPSWSSTLINNKIITDIEWYKITDDIAKKH